MTPPAPGQSPPNAAPSWEFGTFEGLRRQQLQSWASTPFVEKVRWLEQAQRVADQLQSVPSVATVASTIFPDGPIEP